MAAEHTPTEPRHLAQLANESWPWQEGQDGPDRTWKKAALSRLRCVGVCVREEDEPLVKQMLQDVKSGKTTSFGKKRRERLAHDKLLPAAIMACVSMCDGVAITIGERLFNPVAREELKDLQEAPVFSWALLSDEEFLGRLSKLFAGVWLFVSLPISFML